MILSDADDIVLLAEKGTDSGLAMFLVGDTDVASRGKAL
jgi:hypothetical protein